jgi:peroxiredoxin Q/BCP
MLEAYGVWQEKNLYGQKSMGIVRTTYIIGMDGKIRNVFPKVKVEGHAQEVLAALKS